MVVPLFARNFKEQLFKGIRDAVWEFMLIAGDDDKLNMAKARDLRERPCLLLTENFGAQKRWLRASSSV